ncbi:unnamed protein product [Trifolium pratense]|uniref:Uncharacterized protein n=1 Tax=Trifolium pratense TaxID=57577 RepID=A0ACB0L3Y0_TRIPR|nr:unnamed protein product [Trifolium pratense]
MITYNIKITLFVPCNEIEDDVPSEALTEKEETITKVVSHPELIKDLDAQNGAMYLDKGSTSGVSSSNTANYLPKVKVEGDETMVNDVAEIKFDDHENQLGDRDVETLRKSRRLSKPSMKALEAVVDKYEEETRSKSRRGVETPRKSRRPAKPSMKTLEDVVDKYEKETSRKRRQDVETLRKSRRLPKPSMKALEAVVDKYEEEASCKRRRV